MLIVHNQIIEDALRKNGVPKKEARKASTTVYVIKKQKGVKV